MKRLVIALCLLAAPVLAQDQKSAEPNVPQVQKLFVLKYADPNQVANLIRVFTGSVTPNSAMQALAVSATREAMTAIEDAIKRLDVPSASPQNVDLTVYLLVGGPSDGSGIPLPKELDSVVAQLRNAFAYKSYRLMDVLAMRSRTGQRVETSGNSGSVQIGGLSQPITSQFRIESVTVGGDGAIRINGLRSSNRIPVATGTFNPVSGAGNNPVVNTQFAYQDVGISADVDVKEGQKVVVGKSGMNPNEAMFVVLTARIAQ